MKTPAKKRTAAELAAAALWCALTLGTDRLFFRYDWRTPAFFVYKALFLVLAFGLVHGAVTLVQKLRAGDKFARRWVAWTLPYLAVNLVILLIVWPGIWGNDDLAVLYLARTLQPNSWQHFLTSGAFILSLMFVPMPGGVVLVQNLLISGIVGCFAATAQDLAEKRLTRPVRPAWFALVYLPFLLPPVLMHTQQPFRTTWSTWTELFLVFMLVAIYLRGTKLNKKELAAIVILGTLAASWRSECVYYLAAIPVLLALLCACAAPEAALPEPPAAQVQSPEEPPAPVEPPVEPIIEEEPEPVLLLSEPVWLLGRLTELYQADETQWAALADVLEAAKTLNADAQLEGLETVQFQGREYIPLAEAAQRLGLEWGEAPDGLRYLARRQTVGQIPEGWNVPVLMYHAVGDEIWGYSDLFVSEAGMEEQLQYLQENGYEPIWFSDLAHIEDYEKPVILTFDDGYDDNYTVLYPLLEKYQTKATIFVIGNAMGSQHKMTQEQVYELAASGLVSIQSHTYTHGNLSAMDEPALRQEMELSNAALAAATGQIPYVLCYPEGKYSHLTMDVAKDYYTFALRMDGWTYQTGMDPYQVPRSFVSRRITLPDYLWFLAPSGKAS